MFGTQTVNKPSLLLIFLKAIYIVLFLMNIHSRCLNPRSPLVGLNTENVTCFKNHILFWMYACSLFNNFALFGTGWSSGLVCPHSVQEVDSKILSG